MRKYLPDIAIYVFIVVITYFNANLTYTNFFQKTPQKPLYITITENVVVLPKNENISKKDFVSWKARQAGLDHVFVDRLIQCESSWNEKAVNPVSQTKGLWQIHPIHGLTDECMFNPVCSTNWAIEKRLRDGNWNAWECANFL